MMGPFPFQMNWFSFPFHLLGAFGGDSQLPIYELDKVTVAKAGKRVRPLPAPSDTLRMGAWRLAHAITKADCARGAPSWFFHSGAAGFLIQNLFLFDWNPANLRLAYGMADFYADFTRTSLSGRIAQGMNVLFMENRGYSFVERFFGFLIKNHGQAGAKQLMKDKAKHSAKPKSRCKTPDFVFEQHTQDLALSESKGGFVAPNRKPNIKGDLNDALNQLEGWDTLLTPSINKSFAVGTYLREKGDLSPETSLIAFVDPNGSKSKKNIEFPPDSIRRGNYAGWLAGMGFVESANRLQQFKPHSYMRARFPVFTLGGRHYAFAVMSVRPGISPLIVSDEELWLRRADWPFRPFELLGEGIAMDVMGLELTTLKRISRVILTDQGDELMSLGPMEEKELPQKLEWGRFAGSAFLDGTIFGEIQIPHRMMPEISFVEVDL
jgi:hypothetical protein